MWRFPARFLAEFFDNHGMLGFTGRPRWRTIGGGSRRYVDQRWSRPWRDAAAQHAGTRDPRATTTT